MNNFEKSKKMWKIFYGETHGPRYYRFMKKTRAQKSHAAVPLIIRPDKYPAPLSEWGIRGPLSTAFKGTDGHSYLFRLNKRRLFKG